MSCESLVNSMLNDAISAMMAWLAALCGTPFTAHCAFHRVMGIRFGVSKLA